MKSYKFYIDNTTWDCEVSIVDSSRIYRYLIKNGHKHTNNPSDAEYIIINTCGFIESFKKRSITLYEKYNLEKNKNATIIFFGCLVKIEPELIKSLNVNTISPDEEYKFDEIFYNKVKLEEIKPYSDEETKRILKRNTRAKQPRYLYFVLSELMLQFFKRLRWNYNKIIDSYLQKNRNFIEIGRGCTGNCSYCVIKKARGNIKSRPIKDIILDIDRLNDPSKKLYLVANDCGCYGLDIDTNLINLLYEINKKFPKLSIELDYLNPFLLEKYRSEYIKLFVDVNIDYVTIPMQGGSNKILKNMKRNYDAARVVKIIDDIKKDSPKTFIYSHFIIGFPGENWIDFFKMLNSARHFDLPIPFRYSENKQVESVKLPKHKSKLMINTRFHLAIIYFNFVIFFKLLTHPKLN